MKSANIPSDTDLEKLWRNRRGTRKHEKTEIERAFALIEAEVAENGLNNHFSFIARAAYATGDPRFYACLEALPEHGLAASMQKTKSRLNALCRERYGRDFRQECICDDMRRLMHEQGISARAAAKVVAAAIGFKANSFKAAWEELRRWLREPDSRRERLRKQSKQLEKELKAKGLSGIKLIRAVAKFESENTDRGLYEKCMIYSDDAQSAFATATRLNARKR